MSKQKQVETADQISILTSGMKKDGYNFFENPAIFKWKLPEHPDVNYTLIIQSNQVEGNFDPSTGSTLQ